MQIWQLLLLVFVLALLVGSIAGAIIGKSQMRAKGHAGLFSQKERIILLAVLLVGVGVVLFGVFYTPGGNVEPDFWGPEGGGMEIMPGNGGAVMRPTPGGIDGGGIVIFEGDENEILPDDEFASNGEDEEVIAEEQPAAVTPAPTQRPPATPARPTPRPGGGGGVVVRPPGGGAAIQIR